MLAVPGDSAVVLAPTPASASSCEVRCRSATCWARPAPFTSSCGSPALRADCRRTKAQDHRRRRPCGRRPQAGQSGVGRRVRRGRARPSRCRGGTAHTRAWDEAIDDLVGLNDGEQEEGGAVIIEESDGPPSRLDRCGPMCFRRTVRSPDLAVDPFGVPGQPAHSRPRRPGAVGGRLPRST